jgi:hypothetical protein
VHEHEPCLRIASKESAKIARPDPVNGHPPCARVVACVDLEGEVVVDYQFNAAGRAPVAENQARRLIHIILGKDGGEGSCCLVI